MSYTKGKWKVNEDACGDVFISGQNGEYIAEIGNPDDGGWYDANRIVDCVNACVGMENPDNEIAKLRRERDELLRVMIEIKADCDEASSYGDKVCVATLDVDRVIELCGGK